MTCAALDVILFEKPGWLWRFSGLRSWRMLRVYQFARTSTRLKERPWKVGCKDVTFMIYGFLKWNLLFFFGINILFSLSLGWSNRGHSWPNLICQGDQSQNMRFDSFRNEASVSERLSSMIEQVTENISWNWNCIKHQPQQQSHNMQARTTIVKKYLPCLVQWGSDRIFILDILVLWSIHSWCSRS